MTGTSLRIAEPTGSSERRRRSKRQPGPAEPLDIYLREVESHDLLSPDEEKKVLAELVATRDRWVETFLASEGGLSAVWSDLVAWKEGKSAAAALIPGPPKLKPGQKGPDYFADRLYRIFEKRIARTKRCRKNFPYTYH